MGAEEPRLLTDVGPLARSRGFYEPHELAAVAKWKTERSKSRIASNAHRDIHEVTAMAFGASEELQQRVLTLLHGVGEATATALLAVAFPERHTIFDFRSTGSTTRKGERNGTGGYVAYLSECRRVARSCTVDLRTLDRALWKWSSDGYPDG